jgi:hypothetical protein
MITTEQNFTNKNSPLEEYPRSGGGVLTSSTNTVNFNVKANAMETPRQTSSATPHEGNFSLSSNSNFK